MVRAVQGPQQRRVRRAVPPVLREVVGHEQRDHHEPRRQVRERARELRRPAPGQEADERQHARVDHGREQQRDRRFERCIFARAVGAAQPADAGFGGRQQHEHRGDDHGRVLRDPGEHRRGS